MSAGLSLDDLGRHGARSFLQTVLVIDNELELGSAPAGSGPGPAPRLGNPHPTAFGAPRPDPVALTTSGSAPAAAPAAAPAPSPVTVPARPTTSSGDASRLDVKTIMDAFLSKSLICGMHRPDGRDDLVREAINAARRSDAVIVDWLLVGSDPTPAKDIIAGIMDGDREDHGRLRLIVVYTSDSRVLGIAAEIMARIGAGRLIDKGDGVLVGPETRIVVLNKAGTTGARDTVAVADLPERIVAEFARLSEGLLSTFAVTAVAAIRRATHHVLAVFSSELDGAFLAHRCALKSPDDATEFALELLAGEFKGAVTRSGEATRILAAGPLAEWIGRRAEDGAVRSTEVQIDVDTAKGFAGKGEAAVLDAKQDHISVPGQPKPKGGVGKKALKPMTVGRLFHDTEAAYRDAHHRLARLAQFKNEPYGIRAPRGEWRPMLSLGTLLASLDAEGHPIHDRYLLCTQPRCDAVRIGERRRFPFQVAKAVDHEAFNAVATQPGVGGAPDVPLRLSVDMKPYDTVMIEFQATSDERVTAVAANGSYTFADMNGGQYLWLGDFRDLTAQRAAGKVAARLHDVGFDEFEWLRLHAGESPPKAPAAPSAGVVGGPAAVNLGSKAAATDEG